MRDAIVYGYDWDAAGPIERIALALARSGAKVLHCDAARSIFKRPDTSLRQLEPNLYTFRPSLIASRLNRYPGAPRLQGGWMARQILARAQALGLNKPVFVYGCPGPLFPPLRHAMRERGCLLVHLYTDSMESSEEVYVGRSDLTVVFSPTAFLRLRARWGEKIHSSWYGVDLRPFRAARHSPDQPPPLLARIRRPRLGYAGAFADEFLNTRVLRELLERRPEWSFISFNSPAAGAQMAPAVPLPNAHVLPWQRPEELARCVAAFDVGFMPYDCSNFTLLNTRPMKLLDYFALGLPVVATPLIDLREHKGLVYLGETAEELEDCVEAALSEPPDSPLRQRRRELAERHSIEEVGRSLQLILG